MKDKPKIQNRSTKHDETIKAIPLACADEKAAVEFMEAKRWGDSPSCPHCGGLNPYQMKDSKTGERQANFRWRCHDCKEQFTAYKKPKYIEFRMDLPKTNVGKILRRELRDEKKSA